MTNGSFTELLHDSLSSRSALPLTLCPIKVKTLEAVLECCFQDWLEESMLSTEKFHIDNTVVAINLAPSSDSPSLDNDVKQ